MATTTNYGWTTPDDTALVKDGASAIRTLGSSVDTSLKTVSDGRGLVHINTTSVSAVSSQSFNNVFTSTYTNYRIVIDNMIGATANQDLNLRLRVGGVDASTGIYNAQELRGSGTTTSAARTTNGTVLQIGSIGYSAGETSSVVVELQNPQAATRTTWIANNMFLASGTGAINLNVYGYVANATQYDGFTIFGTTYAITGTISIFGYKK